MNISFNSYSFTEVEILFSICKFCKMGMEALGNSFKVLFLIVKDLRFDPKHFNFIIYTLLTPELYCFLLVKWIKLFFV